MILLQMFEKKEGFLGIYAQKKLCEFSFAGHAELTRKLQENIFKVKTRTIY